MVGGRREDDRRARQGPRPRPACAGSGSRGRCTARSASTPTTACCGRRSCGTTAAARPNAPRSRRRSRARARSPATSPCRASPRRSSPGSGKHEPATFEKIDMVLLPKDYIRFRLTGHHVSEMSDASGTLWLDVANRDWSDDLLEATGLTRANMPRLVEGSEPSGELLPALAERWGVDGHGRRRGRRRRQRRGGLRRRGGEAGHGLRLDRHLGGALRLERALLAEHRGRGPRLLPRDPGRPGTRWG